MAQSPFYQLLVGRALGYREGNIRHHIQVFPNPVGRACACASAAMSNWLPCIVSCPLLRPFELTVNPNSVVQRIDAGELPASASQALFRYHPA